MKLDDILQGIRGLRGTHEEFLDLLCCINVKAREGVVSDMYGAEDFADAIIDAVTALDRCTAEDPDAPAGPLYDFPREVMRDGH